MTHSDRQRARLGDQGQRWEITYIDGRDGKRVVMGWASDWDTGAAPMLQAIEQHPVWHHGEAKNRFEFASPALESVMQERLRQRVQEGFGDTWDDQYTASELPRAAICLALKAVYGTVDNVSTIWPKSWSLTWLHKRDTYRRSLVKAAALLIAEIERSDRRRKRDEELPK